MRWPQMTVEERFNDKVSPEPTSGCWLWTGSFDGRGYGSFAVTSRRAVGAHRLAWELSRGKIPAMMVIDHLCRTPACVNPSHLEPVSNKVNILRGVSPSAEHARASMCAKGHPFDVIRPSGRRRCRRCEAAASRRYVSGRSE